HRITVDAYAVQHPGQPSPQTIQSVALHLISLCLVLEGGYPMNLATAAMQASAKNKRRFVWLSPPESRGAITVADVLATTTALEHKSTVRRWAESAWGAWSLHQSTIREWLPKNNTMTQRRSFHRKDQLR